MATAIDQELSKFRTCSTEDLDELDEPVTLSLIDRLRVHRQTYLAQLRFYATIFFSLLAICTAFVFVFLVAFVIEPAVTTLRMDFQLKPATCCVRSYREEAGAENCAKWSSCREGCTREVYQCFKITVAYTERSNATCTTVVHDDNSAEEGDGVSVAASDHWLYDNARLFPNVKGCGYPPSLNCTVFAEQYGAVDTPFPCHYSRVDPQLVITELDPALVKRQLVLAIVIPLICVLVSVVFLVHAYLRARAVQVAASASPCSSSSASSSSAAAAAAEGGGGSGDGTSRAPSPFSKAASTYSLRSISSRINSGVVRFARDLHSRDSDGDQLELQPIGGDTDECQLLQPCLLPCQQRRHHRLPPLEPAVSETVLLRETAG